VAILLAQCIPASTALMSHADGGEDLLRVATFNCSLNRDAEGQLIRDLKGGENLQARKVARILRTVRPDIVLLNEFDFDADSIAVTSFLSEYLQVDAPWALEPPVSYDYFYSAPVNTGVPSGRDLDKNGRTEDPADAIGFGKFPGQYGMVLLSQFPIDRTAVRTFQRLLWKNLPDAALPVGKDGVTSWYDAEDLAVLRLSSKSHWDVPVNVHGKFLHILASHPTPPAFDGPEDRNGRRNHDEIRLWSEYLSEGPKAWLVDDQGMAGPLKSDADFVLLGDQNADPQDGDSYQNAINQLLQHPRINSSVIPSCEGGAAASKNQKRANETHKGDPSHDTSDFNDRSVGNLRVDYVLPSRGLQPVAAEVFWLTPDEPGADLIDCSDHRLVWLDLQFPAGVP
jgi:endonuclease/exonuclease/phosphatase family metal-dependent hydrolase